MAMTFSKKELQEFQKIIEEDYHCKLNDEEALIQATAIIDLFEVYLKDTVDNKKETVNNE